MKSFDEAGRELAESYVSSHHEYRLEEDHSETFLAGRDSCKEALRDLCAGLQVIADDPEGQACEWAMSKLGMLKRLGCYVGEE